jgi:signal transduction histidine kinase/ActR/RegA family two-component response regulator
LVESIFESHSGEFTQAREATLAHGEWSGELAAVNRQGRRLILESRWTLLRDDQGAPRSILLINTDETERKKLEAQFLRGQRLESIGTLAGGIAHDLNNVLSPILTSLELIRSRLPDSGDQELIDIIEASANRGAEMVKQILVFARGAEGQRTRLDLPKILWELEKIIRETFPRNLRIQVHAARDLWPIVGDATQLQQVLLNLCVNARDAMPEGGTLTLRAANLPADDPDRPPDAAAAAQVLIEVGDTGEGISEENRERIFDPFFTTKELGKGTGLGLSTAQAIVKNHGGSIGVRSESGHGATFRILLPTSATGRPGDAQRTKYTMPVGRGELVLVVDDEASIRSVTQRTLENFGYRVVVAKNGGDGLAVFHRNRAEVAAVITDMMMPLLDGPAMIREIRLHEPDLPIVAVTGLAATDNLTRARDAGAQAFLPKPYPAEMLLQTLADLLRKEEG